MDSEQRQDWWTVYSDPVLNRLGDQAMVASLGLTFTNHVTIGIPLYILIATALTEAIPVR